MKWHDKWTRGAILFFGAAVGVLAVGQEASQALQSAAHTPAEAGGKRPVRVFVVAGQSNAEGHNQLRQYQGGREPFPETFRMQPRILFWPGSDAAQASTNLWTTLRVGESGAFGPEIGLAHDLEQALPGTTIAIVKYAVGATGIARSADYNDYIPSLAGYNDHGRNWHPPTDGREAGTLYTALLANVRNALSALAREGKQCELAGFVWMQGEHEGGISRKMAQDYETLLRDFIRSVRQDLGAPALPFVIGQVNAHTWAFGDLARKSQAEVCRKDKQTLLVVTLDLPRGDGAHFDANGMLTLGSRFAAALENLVPELPAALRAASFKPASAKAPVVSLPTLLQEMADRTVLTHWPTAPYRSLQASSYNRASKTPDDPVGWFANADCGFALRTETNGGRTEAVLMEHQGPGVLTRIWTPFFFNNFKNRTGTDLRIYLDGESTPRVATNFIALVRGEGPVPPPFAQPTCRAGDLYLPIPFRKSCKITQEGGAFFYIINYRAYAPGTEVESFRPEFLEEQKALLEKVGQELMHPTDFTGGTALALAKEIPGKASASLELPAGPSAVRHLEFRIQAANLAQALRSTVLEMVFDGEPTVWCPLGDFFSNVNGIDPYRMWEREVRADGTMICRWIMPYKTDGKLVLHNLASLPVTVKLDAAVSRWGWTTDSLHFHTSWWTDVPQPPRPVWDMNFLEVTGRGIHVGDTLVVLNPLWSWWGEGDEKIYVDDDLARRFPSQWGTGSEDYYGWAGGEVPTRKDEFSAPFLANVRVGGQKRDWPAGKEPFTHGYNICTRTRSLDATPFARRFKFDMEAFNMIATPDAFLQYALVTHWYGAPGVSHNRPPLPEAAAAPVPQTEDVAALAGKIVVPPGAVHLKDAIELEDVNEVTLSSGLKGGAQYIGQALSPYQWSNDAQFWGRATKIGDAATFTFLEQYHPRRIILYPTVSHDYGTLNLYVNGALVQGGWDGYDPAAQPGKPMDLGVQAPDGNVIRLRVEVSGKNPKSAGYFFGLDCVVLGQPTPSQEGVTQP
jgi:hypothetical protein